jgi:hypothetical protein
MKAFLPWLVGWLVGLVVPILEIFVLRWLLYSDQYKIFFSSLYTISIPLLPFPSKLGKQSCWVTCLLVCVSGWLAGYCKLVAHPIATQHSRFESRHPSKSARWWPTHFWPSKKKNISSKRRKKGLYFLHSLG